MELLVDLAQETGIVYQREPFYLIINDCRKSLIRSSRMDMIVSTQELIDQSRISCLFWWLEFDSNPTFRTSQLDGIYSVKLEGIFTAEQSLVSYHVWALSTGIFDFYKKHLLIQMLSPMQPHAYLANLEKAGKLKVVVWPKISIVCIWNGCLKGSKLHGSADRNYCLNCHILWFGRIFWFWWYTLTVQTVVVLWNLMWLFMKNL